MEVRPFYCDQITLKLLFMKASFDTRFWIFLLTFTSTQMMAQFDDLYYDYRYDSLPSNEKIEKGSNKDLAYNENNNHDSRYEDQDFSDERSSDDEYDNYDDYSYTRRIRRFGNTTNIYYYSGFDTWYDDIYYDPIFDQNFNVNVWVGSPYYYTNWNRWNRNRYWDYWAYDPWFYRDYYYWGNNWGCPTYASWGWNHGWGHHHHFDYYHDYVHGWGHHGWGHHGWGHHGWGHHGWYNGSNNNGSSGTQNGNGNTYYGSRRGGSLTTSTKGRNASPRRLVTEDPKKEDTGVLSNDQNVDVRSKQNNPKLTERIYKTDNPRSDASKSKVKDYERERIYSRRDRSSSPVQGQGNKVETLRNQGLNNNTQDDRESRRDRNSNMRSEPGVPNHQSSRDRINRDNSSPRSSSHGGFDGGSSPNRSSSNESRERSQSAPRSSSHGGFDGGSSPNRSSSNESRERSQSAPRSSSHSGFDGGSSYSRSSSGSSSSGNNSSSSSSRSSGGNSSSRGGSQRGGK
jgi:hypothetical protein